MKEGWTYKKLGEVCRIERGGSPRPIKAFITNDTNGLNWIKIGDTDPQGKYIYSTKEKIRPEGLKKSRWVEENEFLLSNSMSFGRPYVLKTNGCIHDGWLVLRDYQESLNTDFFYYLLISPTVQRQFKTKAQGSTVSNLNTDRVAGVNVLFPTIEKQLSIVARLDAAFAHIDALKANAEKQLAEARQLFQAELAECMRQKEGWEEKKMSDFFEITSSKRVFQKDWTTSGIPFYRAREIVKINKQGFVDNELFITEEMYEEYKKKYGVPQIGDILITGVGTLGVCYVIKDSKKFYYKDGNIIWLKKKSSINSDFVTYQYLCPSIKKQIYKTEGATVGTYTITNANDTKILVPSIETQNQIVSRLDALSANIKQLEEVQRKTLAECDALKQAMLREVFE